MNEYKTIGIIYAMHEEFLCIKRHVCLNINKITEKPFDISYINMSDKKVFLINSGIGKVNAAVATSILINQYQVELIINVGIAGAACDDLMVGDVVCPSKLVYYDVDVTVFGYKYGQIPRMPSYYESGQMYELFNNKYDINIVDGTLCTGDSFLTTKHSLLKIKEIFSDIMVVDMEGAAIGQVCLLFQKPLLLLKGVSDSVNEASTEDSEKNVNLAMLNVTKLLFLVLQNLTGDYYYE